MAIVSPAFKKGGIMVGAGSAHTSGEEYPNVFWVAVVASPIPIIDLKNDFLFMPSVFKA
jgi:hypothetical protein